jgi:hypothetical protein
LANFSTSELKAAETGDDSNSETGLGPSRFRTRRCLYSWQNELRPGYGALTTRTDFCCRGAHGGTPLFR